MSIIPFVLNGVNKTVVESRQEYEQAHGLEGEVIFIQNLDRSQISDTKSSNATYDLRVGTEYKGHRDAGKTDLLDGESISLEPGAAVIIETMESVQFPKSRFGHIVPKVTLLQNGISNTSSKIDPGYHGHLLVTVFNLGKRTIYLKKEEKFCTFYVLEVARGVLAYEKVGKKLPGTSKKNLLRRIADYTESHPTFFNVLLTIATTVLTVVTILALVRQPQQIQSIPPKTDAIPSPKK